MSVTREHAISCVFLKKKFRTNLMFVKKIILSRGGYYPLTSHNIRMDLEQN